MAKIGLPLLMIALAIGLAIWAYQSPISLRSNQENLGNTTQGQPATANSNGWQSFNNSTIGVSFRYPTGARLSSFNSCVMGADENDPSSHWNVIVDDPDNSLDAKTNTNYDIIFFENINKKSCSSRSIMSLDAKAFGELIREENLTNNSPYISNAAVGAIETYRIGEINGYRLAVAGEYNFLGESGVLRCPRIYIIFENRAGDVVVAVYSEHQAEIAKAILETVTIN